MGFRREAQFLIRCYTSIVANAVEGIVMEVGVVSFHTYRYSYASRMRLQLLNRSLILPAIYSSRGAIMPFIRHCH